MNIQERILKEYTNATSPSEKMAWKRTNTRFSNARTKVKDLASEGIERYFQACASLRIQLEPATVCEILEDAGNGRQVWKESDSEFWAQEQAPQKPLRFQFV